MTRFDKILAVEEAMLLNLEGINNTVDHHDQEANDLDEALFDLLLTATKLWAEGELTAL